MATLDDVNDILAAFLLAATDALELTEAGAPGRIYTSASRPALDCCGQLTCWAQFLGDGETLNPPGGLGASMRSKLGHQPVLTIIIQATRCAPVPKDEGGKITLPSAADLAAVSRTCNQDLWALWNHLNAQLRNGGTLAEVCSGAVRDGATAVDGQGGCVGWEITYRYNLEGGYPFEMAT